MKKINYYPMPAGCSGCPQHDCSGCGLMPQRLLLVRKNLMLTEIGRREAQIAQLRREIRQLRSRLQALDNMPLA